MYNTSRASDDDLHRIGHSRLAMRLINTKTLEVCQFAARETPAYAILSHRWGEDEVTLQDIQRNRHTERRGFAKVRSFCELAAADGFEYCVSMHPNAPNNIHSLRS